MYEFQYHPAENIMEIRISGLWTPEMVEHYRQDALAARHGHGRLKFLVDCRDSLIAPQDSAERMMTLSDSRVPGDRTAVLVASSLAKLQARRVLQGWPETDIFMSENAARMWLDARDDVQPVALTA